MHMQGLKGLGNFFMLLQYGATAYIFVFGAALFITGIVLRKKQVHSKTVTVLIVIGTIIAILGILALLAVTWEYYLKAHHWN